MDLNEVMSWLEARGSEQTKKTLMKHGAREPFFGVKVADLKILQKKIKKDYALSKALFDTGNSDAMYLAGLIADPAQMTREDLQDWVSKAYWYYISEYTVAWVCSESAFGWELAAEWINHPDEGYQTTGWATYSSLLSITPDEHIDRTLIERLVDRVKQNIAEAPNRTRYTMNGFLIAVGSYFEPLHTLAYQVAEQIGKVSVSMGSTACKVPFAPDYIQKVADKQQVGKKRKSAIC